jgi:parallel beta-helix repeat protein
MSNDAGAKGFWLSAATDSAITDCTTTGGTNIGFYLSSGSHRNTITRPAASGTPWGIYIGGGSNATIDCQGRQMAGNNKSGTYGIYSTQFNTTVKNCNISNYQHAIYINGGASPSITGSLLSTTKLGGNALYLYNSPNAYVYGNAVQTSGKMGIYVQKSGGAIIGMNNVSTTSSASQEYAAVYVGSYVGDGSEPSSNVQLYGNVIAAPSGNGLALYIRPNCGNVMVVGNIISSSTPAFWGVRTYRMFNSMIANNTITNPAGTGLYLQSARMGNVVEGNVFNTSSENIKFYQSPYRVDVAYNKFYSNGDAVNVDSSSNHLFRSNTFLTRGAYLGAGSSGNLFYWNNFTSGIYYINDASSGNFYNTTINGKPEGNIYANVISGAVAVQGNVSSGYGSGLYIGMNGSGYPYSQATSQGKILGSAVDYAPLTPLFLYPTGNLVVSVDPQGAGNAAGTAYGFAVPSTRDIQAISGPGYDFWYWSSEGDCSIAYAHLNETTVTTNSGTCEATAHFVEVGDLVPGVSPEGAGTVTADAYHFTVPALVMVYPHPNQGYALLNWSTSGDCSVYSQYPTHATIQVNSGTCYVTGHFSEPGSLITGVSPSGSGNTTGTAYSFSVPANLLVEAFPSPGYTFLNWTTAGDCYATVPHIHSTTVHVESGTCYATANFGSP